jgi:hypothetical protein
MQEQQPLLIRAVVAVAVAVVARARIMGVVVAQVVLGYWSFGE